MNPQYDRILSAAQQNRPDIISTLVKEMGCPPGYGNQVGQTALHIASLWGNREAVAALLALGAPVNAQNRMGGSTPLHTVVSSSKEPFSNRIDCARMLIAAGADPELADYGYGKASGSTPLDILEDEVESGMIADDDNVEEMRKVLTAGGVIQRSKLFDLIDVHDIEGIKMLLGESVEGLNEFDRKTGLTPLQYAVDKLLLCLNPEDGEEAQDHSSSQKLADIIEMLLKNGADANAEPKRRVKRGDDAGMLPTNDGSDTPLHRLCMELAPLYASSSDDIIAKGAIDAVEKVANAFVEAGGAEPEEATTLLLHDACRRGNLHMVQFLIESIGVNPNHRGRQGLTPLHFGARSGRTEIVEWLLSHKGANGAIVDASILDDRGKTALDAARANDKADIVALLEKVTD
mmetsp:Transcript_18485/g.53044  ORF Transcript_18485/g.53044 Transcript_18485/m.53044 type:complete len:404 (-) Transcript_18485:2831-4042(-)